MRRRYRGVCIRAKTAVERHATGLEEYAMKMRRRVCGLVLVPILVGWAVLLASSKDDLQHKPSRVVVISLDGAQPDLVKHYLRTGVLRGDIGLGRLERRGIVADQNVTATPSVTAVAHLAIATGSTAVHNDVPLNTFHPVAASIGASLSGFGAPIGGYQISPVAPAAPPTAEPLWVPLRQAGKRVVTATWPGGDGVDVSVLGTIVQPAAVRTTDYTVPFGAFGGLGAQGFSLPSAAFAPVPPGAPLLAQLAAAGRQSFSQVQVTTAPVETFFCAPTTLSTCGSQNAQRTRRYDIMVAALDTSPDGSVNYDTLVFFDGQVGVPPGPFSAPSTGPAYVKAGGTSGAFFFEGSGNRIGCAFFVTAISANLSTVRFVRYSANFIPRNAAVIADVDDVNTSVGFWRPQPDFRIPERLSPGFELFSDEELEAAYRDQVRTFVEYQTRVAVHAILANPEADLVMAYIEQPDGSGHTFTLTDPRQATNPLDPESVGAGQDRAKMQRYASHLAFGYQAANEAVERIIQAVGVDKHGAPLADVFVVSDHGMAPFHTAVRLNALLAGAGINTSLLGIRTTGPAANIYLNLSGREAGGTVLPSAYQALVDSVASALRAARDPNPFFNPDGSDLFTDVWTRPTGCGRPGFCTSDDIGQDSGDVVALMAEGYNFDGTQPQVVFRTGDVDPPVRAVYSVPNFYGAHGHNSELPSMSAILYASGPSLKQSRRLWRVQNVDIAPTIMKILGVVPAVTVDGEVIDRLLRSGKD
jgi:predicted AlkP superfamily pyrophosphatase or phosphodiesterase